MVPIHSNSQIKHHLAGVSRTEMKEAFSPPSVATYTVNGHNLRFFFHVFYHEAHEEHEEKLFFNSDLRALRELRGVFFL